MPQLKAILLDFDGVIVDSEPLHFESFCEVLAPFNITLDRREYNDHYLGYDDLMVLKLVSRGRSDMDMQTINRLAEEKTQWMRRELVARCPVLPGSAELIRDAHEKGVKLGVCSGALRHEILLTLEAVGLMKYFGTIIAADDVEISKPDPMGYLLCARQLDAEPDECVVVEDSPVGMAAAKAAGMKVCGLTTSYAAGELKTADLIAKDLSKVTLDNFITLLK